MSHSETAADLEAVLRSGTGTVPLAFAAQKLGIGRGKAFELLGRGEFPCRTLRLGHAHRVPVSSLRKVLEMPEPGERVSA